MTYIPEDDNFRTEIRVDPDIELKIYNDESYGDDVLQSNLNYPESTNENTKSTRKERLVSWYKNETDISQFGSAVSTNPNDSLGPKLTRREHCVRTFSKKMKHCKGNTISNKNDLGKICAGLCIFYFVASLFSAILLLLVVFVPGRLYRLIDIIPFVVVVIGVIVAVWYAAPTRAVR